MMEFETKLEKLELLYSLFSNPYKKYESSKIIKSSKILIEDVNELEFFEKIKDPTLKDKIVENIEKRFGKNIPNPKGLHSWSIFGTTSKTCLCGLTRGYGKKCKVCGVVMDYKQNISRNHGFINLNYPVFNPLILSEIYRILKGGKQTFMSLMNKIILDYQFLLFNRKKKRFEPPEGIKFYLISGNNKIKEKYEELIAETSYKDFFNKFYEFALQYDLIKDNEKYTWEYYKDTYVLSKPAFGLYTLIYAILSNEEIFNEYILKFKYPTHLINSITIIIPVITAELRKFMIVGDELYRSDYDRILTQIVIMNEKFEKLTDNPHKLSVSINIPTSDGKKNHETNTEQISSQFDRFIYKPFITYNQYSEYYYRYAHHGGVYTLFEYCQENKEYLDKNLENLTIPEIFTQERQVNLLQQWYIKYVSKLLDSELGKKEGLVRQFLIGKTIDFSARNVITPTLEVKPYEILVSYYTARQIFKMEFLIFLRRLYTLFKYKKFTPCDVIVQKPVAPKSMIKKLNKIKLKDNGKYFTYLIKLIYQELEYGAKSPKELDITDEQILEDIEFLFDLFAYNVNKGRIKLYSFINRQPTLWEPSMIVYDAKINTNKEDYTLKIHPLIVESFNADYDGDSVSQARVIIEFADMSSIILHLNPH